MPDPGYSSPFPTAHDTIGASTLATPLFMPSSPPPQDNAPVESPERAKSPVSDRVATKSDAHSHEDRSPESSRSASPVSSVDDLDARLDDYTLDFTNFPSAQLGSDAKDEPLEVKTEEQDKLSDVEGPEDFTTDMEKYLFGNPLQKRVDKPKEDAPQSPKLHQSTVEDAELGEYSEFGPPVDMSTPSHLLHRNSKLSKDATHLEDIEEGSDDMDKPATPSPKQKDTENHKNEDDLHKQIADLRHVIQDRDEQLEKNHTRVLEAASAGEQIRYLQAELQRATGLLDELRANRGNESMLREQIQSLQKQKSEREASLQMPTMHASEISALQKQIGDMQNELRSRNTHTDLESERLGTITHLRQQLDRIQEQLSKRDATVEELHRRMHAGIDAERLETIAHLRQQLDRAQEQLKKRDGTLEETMTKLRATTTAKEQQLREKNTEIDDLRAQIDHQQLEIEKLDSDAERANSDYQDLQDRFASLEAKNRPLEEKNSTLEADLSRAQSRVTVHQNALKAIADRPNESSGNTLTEIMDLIKDLGSSNAAQTENSLRSKSTSDSELGQLRREVERLQTELKDVSATKKATDTELKRAQEKSAETGVFINSIEGENARLTDQVESLKSGLDKAQTDLSRVKEEYSKALEQLKKKTQQPSPPPSPTSPHNPKQDQSKLEKAHQAQLESLQSAHAKAVSNMRFCHAESNREHRNRLAAAEQRETDLKTELESLRSSASSDRKNTKALKAEIKRLESVITAKEESAADLDQLVARAAAKKEKEWQHRFDLLLKERDQMGKALMCAWGEKEVGDVKENYDESGQRVKQAYRFKYFNKNGTKKKT